MTSSTRRGLLAAAVCALAFCAPAAATPGDVLYDQYDHAATSVSGSQNFEANLDPFDDELADDFVVPDGVGWDVSGVEVQGAYFHGPGPATTVNVSVYANASDLPGTLLESRPNQAFTGDPSFAVALDSPIGLGGGRYWLSVQANQSFDTGGQWGWADRTQQSNGASAWQNPGGGQGFGCTSWGNRGSCIGSAESPDQVFRLTGTVGTSSSSSPPAAPPPPPPPPPPHHRRRRHRRLRRLHPRLLLHRLYLRLLHHLRLHHRPSAAAFHACSACASLPQSGRSE